MSVVAMVLEKQIYLGEIVNQYYHVQLNFTQKLLWKV